ncbi:response regulator transcription factor [Flavobacterium jejuense]|uniref:Response regulator transcription factor n=1 Tax=Flavobacterium jejuense TaxID=1544455 RepID=A0ABX0ISM1_9FLAO|nr:LytTR family DNA-binding domain-containing protein [Flavobacterium jejuense]NHN26221.1 response regulator transcription factor [Flavobacterium jejuense]
MIKVLIIEDEIPARKKLKRFLEQLNESITIVCEIGTIEEAISFLGSKPIVDLILSDIELQDGNAFEIYTKVKVTCPIIFTTAYNQFLMDAFESNGIEYLLKPFSFERFKKAWNKFIVLRKSNGSENDLVTKLNQIINQPSEVKTTKKRFTINTSKEMYFLETEAILFFTTEEGVVFAIDKHSKKHLLTQTTLKEIEEVLDSSKFFRINRSDLVNKNHIVKIEKYSKNSLAVKLSGYEKHLVTSQSNTKAFRDWIEE